MLVGRSGSLKIVYGIADPSALPECNVGKATRCLDLDSLPASSGYTLVSSVGHAGFANGAFSNAGDVNGDGVDDILLGANGAADIDAQRGAAFVIFGGRTAPEGGTPVDVNSLPSSEAVRINGPESMATFGSSVSGIGDINNDAKDDIAVSMPGLGSLGARVYVIFGSSLTESPISTATLSPTQGFEILGPIVTLIKTSSAGDVNGDGRPDLLLGGPALTGGDGFGAVVYGPEESPTEPINATALSPDQGYTLVAGDPNADLGSSGLQNTLGELGHLNGDGIPDQFIGASGSPTNGNADAGASYLLFGQRPGPLASLTLGSDLDPSVGVALVGQTASGDVGKHSVPLGDIDADGLPDIAVAGPRVSENGISQSGSIYIVPGAELIGQAKTGLAGPIDQTSAHLGGFAQANGRPSEAYFQWGATDQYGSQTEPQEVGPVKPSSVEAELDGLDASTTYHYRLVVENELGIRSYGTDRTFETSSAPIDRCEQDNTLPGCSGYSGEKFCLDYPADPKCQAQPPTIGLSDLIASAQSAKVQRGRSTIVWAWITSTGTGDANGVKICASVPRKKASVAGSTCRNIDQLAPGRTAKVKFKIKAKARKGAKIRVKLVASSQGVSRNRTANVRLTVR